MNDDFPRHHGFGPQFRKSPSFEATLRWGCTAYSVYSHMYIPRSFGDPEQNFWNLVNNAILCDVAAERQVEITGPDAARFAQYLTPRNLSKCVVGQCKYVFITTAEGGVINDPVLLCLGENHFWLSLADSDVLLRRISRANGRAENSPGGPVHSLFSRRQVVYSSAALAKSDLNIGDFEGGTGAGAAKSGV